MLTKRVTLLAVVVAAAITTGWAQAGVVVLPPNSTVAGKTTGEWTAAWWQWALSFSAPNDPITDPTGANAGLGQAGPVFFLGGTPGGSATRTFTVPADTFILVPLLVGELSQLELGFNTTPAEVRQAAKEQADLIDELHASIDGVPVANLFSYREASPDFQFVAAPGNPVGVPAGDSGVAVADGYWLMLGPIPAGETHVLNYGGGIIQFGFAVDVTATITAVPEPASLALIGTGLASLAGAYGWRKRPLRRL